MGRSPGTLVLLCAWMLRTQDITDGFNPKWVIGSAHEDKAACDATATETHSIYHQLAGLVHRRRGSW